MYRSCSLIQHFAEQGLKVRVRRDCAPRGSKIKKDKEHDYDNSSQDDDKSTGTDIVSKSDRSISYEPHVISPLKINFQKHGMPYESKHFENTSRNYETYGSSTPSPNAYKLEHEDVPVFRRTSFQVGDGKPRQYGYDDEPYRRTSLQLGDGQSKYYERDDEAFGTQLFCLFM